MAGSVCDPVSNTCRPPTEVQNQPGHCGMAAKITLKRSPARKSQMAAEAGTASSWCFSSDSSASLVVMPNACAHKQAAKETQTQTQQGARVVGELELRCRLMRHRPRREKRPGWPVNTVHSITQLSAPPPFPPVVQLWMARPCPPADHPQGTPAA